MKRPDVLLSLVCHGLHLVRHYAHAGNVRLSRVSKVWELFWWDCSCQRECIICLPAASVPSHQKFVGMCESLLIHAVMMVRMYLERLQCAALHFMHSPYLGSFPVHRSRWSLTGRQHVIDSRSVISWKSLLCMHTFMTFPDNTRPYDMQCVGLQWQRNMVFSASGNVQFASLPRNTAIVSCDTWKPIRLGTFSKSDEMGIVDVFFHQNWL